MMTLILNLAVSPIDYALVKIRMLGQGALLAKEDIKSAFLLLPIHPLAFNSLGVFFNYHFYFDNCLPMGCSLSCHYFEMFPNFWSGLFVINLVCLIYYIN